MERNLTVAVVGTSDEFAIRVQAACAMLARDGVRAELTAWDGTRRAVILANPDDIVGETALRLTRQRNGLAIPVRNGQRHSVHELGGDASVDEIRWVVSRLIQSGRDGVKPIVATGSEAHPPGLLGILCERADSGGEFIVMRKGHALLISHEKGRLFEPNTLDVGLFKAKFLNDEWEVQDSVAALRAFQAQKGLVSCSLDATLVEVCVHYKARLPRLRDETVRLATFPDVGALDGMPELLRVAAAAIRKPQRINELAMELGIDPAKVNAFFWAMRGSGLCCSIPSAPVAVPTIATATPKRIGVWRWVAQKFGLTGSSHHG